MKISTRIAASSLLLLAFGATFGVREALRQQQLAANMATVSTLCEISQAAARLTHEAQAERGMSAGYLGSKGANFATELTSQAQRVDDALRAFEELHRQRTRQLPTAFDAAVGTTLTGFGDLTSMRERVRQQRCSVADAVTWYSARNSSLLDLVGIAAGHSSDAAMTTQMGAYNSLLQAKEHAGLERAAFAVVFGVDHYADGMLAKVIRLGAIQQTHLHSFERQAGANGKALLASAQRDQSFAHVEAMRATAMARPQGGFGITASAWFGAATGMIDQLATVETRLGEQLVETASEMRAGAAATAWTIWAIVALFVTLATAATWLLFRNVIRPLQLLVSRFAIVASGDSDLRQRVEVDSNDELGDLARSFNAFVAKVQGVVHQVAGNASSVSAASTELAATAENLTGGARTIDDRCNGAAAAVQQLGANIHTMAAEAKHVSDNLRSFHVHVEEFGEGVQLVTSRSEESLAAARDADEAARSSNEKIASLDEAAQQIGRVIEVIETIASQINLLALNATIEAARAGESGKGFAVVANEVKQLAAQTADATEDIRGRIEAIQSSSRSSIESMQSISSAIERVHQVSSAIASLTAQQSQQSRTLVSTIAEASQSTTAVASSVDEASRAADEVNRQMVGIAEQVRQTQQAADDTRQSSHNLSQLSEQLNHMLGAFTS